MYLYEYSVNCIIDIVIEFRHSASSSDDSDNYPKIGTKVEKKYTIKYLCNQTVITACEILDCYATLSLYSKHVDRLLYCTSYMALNSEIFHSEILGLTNYSMFAQDFKHENDSKLEDTIDCIRSKPTSLKTRDIQSYSHSTQNMNKSSILLLDDMDQ